MKKILTLLILLCIEKSLHAQVPHTPYIYTIKADSIKITNTCDTAELIIENHTQTVPGFLFNKGRGRTEFRRVLSKLDDSIYVIGMDTLKLSGAWLQGGNRFGTTGKFGTLDNNHIDFYTNNIKRGRWTNTGNLLVGAEVDNGYNLAVEGTTYSKVFTNSPTPLGQKGDGALRLRWGGAGGTYIDFYYQGNTNRRGYIASGADGRPMNFTDDIGFSFSTTPFVAIGSEWPTAPNTKFTVTTALNSTQDPMRIGNMITDVNSVSYLKVKASGNTILGEGTDNGNRLQILGSAFISDTLKMPNIIVKADTGSYKPVVVDANGNVFKMNGWAGSSTRKSATVSASSYTVPGKKKYHLHANGSLFHAKPKIFD